MAKLIIALDLATAEAALQIVDELGDAATFYKVGSPLFTLLGPDFVRELRARRKDVFLDLKFHDIPSTVARAVESAARLDVQLLTVHASGGAAMMRAGADAAGPDGPRLLGVTILTSFTPAEVEAVWDKQVRSLRDEVVRLAGITAEAGLHGVVTSPLEAEALRRRHGGDFLIVTPGIRTDADAAGDQARTATPSGARRAGADYIVVGRPITAAADPRAALEAVLTDLEAVPQAAG
jgi:orotidine-5'-phosphate decarboxylase